MIRMLLATTAAFVLAFAVPALACPNCHDCPMHKDKVSATEKAPAKAAAPAGIEDCGCRSKKECTCGAKCDCAAKKSTKKEADKKA